MWPFLRLVRATIVFGRIFVSYILALALQRVIGRDRMQARWPAIHRRNAKRLYEGAVTLRGVFIKMGQVLSIMGNFLPTAYAEELVGLQDQVPPHSYREIERAIRLAFAGKGPDDLYQTFDRKPLAAASLGQVHTATLADGRKVAVKVLYPNIRTIIKVDLKVVGWATTVYRWFIPVTGLERFVDQLRDLLARETAYTHEARCMEKMRDNFSTDPDVVVPSVIWELTNDEVLTMTFMDGVKITNRAALDEMGLDPYAVARKLVEVFYKQLFLDAFFHADPHPGNFMVQKGPDGPRIVILDFGAATEAPSNLVDGMLDILRGLFARDDGLVLSGIETMGFVAKNGNRTLLERTVRHYFQKLLAIQIEDFGKIDPQVAAQLADPGLRKRAELRELMRSVDYPDGWFYVERSVIILFGLAGQLAPRLNTLQVGFPYVMRMMAARTAARAVEERRTAAQA